MFSKNKKSAFVLCLTTVAAVELLVRLYGPREAITMRSYHIVENDRFVWPMCAFLFGYCTNYKYAKKSMIVV